MNTFQKTNIKPIDIAHRIIDLNQNSITARCLEWFYWVGEQAAKRRRADN